MKRVSLFVLILATVLNGFAQQKIEKGQSFIFHGAIDKYPITLILDVFNQEVSGRYYYQKFGNSIELRGRSNDSGYTLESAYGVENESETFILRFFHNELMGTWTKNKKELSVSVSRFRNPIDIYQYHHVVKSSEIIAQAGGNVSDNPDEWLQEAELSFSFLWPEEASKQAESIRQKQFQQLNGFQLGAENASAIRFNEPIDPRTVKGQPQQLLHLMQRISDTFFAQFTNSVLEALTSGSKDYLGNVSLDITNTFRYDSEKYQVLETTQSEYTGGAHGHYFQYHNTWGLEQNKWIEMEDVLTKKQIKALPKAMTQSLKIARQIPPKDPLDQHGFWIKEFDSVGGNTYFTDLGLNTSFGLYEIAPYSEGIVEVFVAWKNLK